MTSNSHESQIDSQLPLIHLEHTHNEYFRDSDTDELVCEVPILPSARFPLAAGISRSELLPLYDPAHIGETYSEERPSDEDHERMRHATAVRFLCGVGSLLGFSAGKLPLVCIDPGTHLDPDTGGNVPLASPDTVKKQMEQTFSVIDHDQRPQLHFAEHLKNIEVDSKQRLLPLWPLEDLIDQRCVLSPQVHFTLGSKQMLFESSIRSPHCEIIELNTPPPNIPKSCCQSCSDHWNEYQIPRKCTGSRKKWLDSETDGVIKRLLAKPLPYLIKLQQTMGGNGTFSARNPRELIEAAHFMSHAYLPNHLPRLTERNVGLQPMNILLSDIVDYVALHVLNFFVKKSGDPVFVGVSQEINVQDRLWAGNTTVYSQQADLKARLGPTMREVTAMLHSKGYYGPVGLDVLEDKAGVQWAVDLNVRTGGSYILGTLSKHFVDRGLDYASLLRIMGVKMRRQAFIEKFLLDFQKGSMIIVGWYETANGDGNGYVVVGADSREELRQKEEMVQAL